MPFMYAPGMGDARLLIFMALAGAALLVNMALALAAAKALGATTARIGKGLDIARSSVAARAWLRTMESASQRAAEWTTAVKTDLPRFGPSLQQARDALKRGIVQADVAGDYFCAAAAAGVRETTAVISAPSRRVLRFFSSLDAVREFFRNRSAD